MVKCEIENCRKEAEMGWSVCMKHSREFPKENKNLGDFQIKKKKRDKKDG